MSQEQFGRRDLFKRAAVMGVGLGLTGGAASARETDDAIRVAQQVNTVPRKQLGSTGDEIPIIVLGCSQKFDSTYDRVLHGAFKQGVNYLDAAQAYAGGQCHKSIAAFIEQVGRKNLWITSKVMLSGRTSTPDMYVKRLEQSILPDSRIDSIEMFFMHSVDQLRQLEPEFIKMGEDLKKRGLIKYFGFSCHRGNVVELMNRAAELGAGAIDCIQFRYNFSMYGDMELNKAIDACKKAGIGLIAMKTQASVPEDSDAVRGFQSKDFNLPQAKLKAVWADDRIDALSSEMTNTQQIRENTDAAKTLAQLSMQDFHQLNRYAAQTASSRCNGCDHLCEPHAGGVDIADTLRYLMYAECYGKVGRARELYQALTESQRAFEGADLSAAMRACPQNIDIDKRLRDAKMLLA
jgi:predicted aldo/keto reductase-like oxidoreductase